MPTIKNDSKTIHLEVSIPAAPERIYELLTNGAVEQAGGKILMPKTKNSDNPESGCISQFIDSEGNRMGLHSNN